MSKDSEPHATLTTDKRPAFFARTIGLATGILFSIIAWSFGGAIGEAAGYYSAKAYYDALPRGDWDPSAHLRALAFALHDGARTGATVGAIAYVALFLALGRRWGWPGFFAAFIGAIIAAAGAAYCAGLSP